MILKLDINKDLQIERLKRTYPNNYQSHINCLNHQSETQVKNLKSFDYYFNFTEDTNDIYNYIDSIVT